ncbi:hypothetical protein [Agrobacterium vitis]|uniref:hypothetical protein n=1 Tax=Agrobacterium vitis TaxID=373 RepID=UPI000A8EF202|nr:hypothetical protein [Agrobacterium vitis]WEO73150.1 hypothetical protein G6L01_007485 [Agrobacterium vitis]
MIDAEAQLHAVVDAWEALPGGRQCGVRDVEAWLARDMAPAINAIRGFLRRPRPDGVLPPSPQSIVMAPAHEPVTLTTSPAQEPITYHNDDAGFTEFLNSDQPYSVREIDGHCAILMDLKQANIIGYRAYDHERTDPVTLTYTNYRGETSERTILPKNIWFGSTEWHPEPQWLLTAFDLGKQTVRDFALKDFGKPTSTELFGLCVLPVPMPFAIGDTVEKHTGDYTAKGEVRGIFATTRGAVRYVVEHQADGGGSFCHIYSEKNLRPARRFVKLSPDERLEWIAKSKAAEDGMLPKAMEGSADA